MTEPFGIYIHIPFCVRKCRYCDFLSFSSSEERMEAYTIALCRELRAAAEEYAGQADTVFIGGGTPSVLPFALFRRILETLYEVFPVAPDAEVTAEMNPGALWTDQELASLFGESETASGRRPLLSRVSLGMQSAHNRELARLGRIHDLETFEESLRRLRRAGAENVNLDLMFGIPGQTEESWEETLRTAISFAPEHISAYSLIVEEGTLFFEEKEKGTLVLPDEDAERTMAHRAVHVLAEAGYGQYEISNFAKKGCESRHNIRYWKRRPYYGAGLGAASFLSHTRWSNTSDYPEYIKIWTDPDLTDRERLSLCRRDPVTLSAQEEMEEFLFLGLRMTEGVSASAFAEQFGKTVEEEYGDVLEKYAGTGLLARRGDRIFLTPEGLDVSNVILSDFLHE